MIRSTDQMASHNGFTLVELVVVIVLVSILSVTSLSLITAPVDAYVAQARRAELVDSAQLAMQLIARDVRQALPNSIRVSSTGTAVEFLQVATGGRFRISPSSTGAGDPLEFDAPDSSFDVLGELSYFEQLNTSSVVGLRDCPTTQAACVVVYNTGETPNNAWNSENVAALRAVSTSSVGLVSSSTIAFPTEPQEKNRFFIVDTPVSFICDLDNRELRRYRWYPRKPSHDDTDSVDELDPLAAEQSLLALDVEACQFDYGGAGSTRGVLGVRLSISRDGETIRLFQQIQVDNQP